MNFDYPLRIDRTSSEGRISKMYCGPTDILLIYHYQQDFNIKMGIPDNLFDNKDLWKGWLVPMLKWRRNNIDL